MARTEKITTLDDLDGSEGARPVRFAFGGTAYEIDLSPANEARLRDALGRYVPHARKTGRPAAGGGGRSAAGRRHSAAVRAWAAGQGIECGERGRIPAGVVAAYDAGHGAP